MVPFSGGVIASGPGEKKWYGRQDTLSAAPALPGLSCRPAAMAVRRRDSASGYACTGFWDKQWGKSHAVYYD